MGWAYHTILSQHGCASNKAEVTDPLLRHIHASERWLCCFTQAFSGLGNEPKYEEGECLWNSCFLAAHSVFLGMSEVY